MAFFDEQKRQGDVRLAALDVTDAAKHLGVSVSYLNRLRTTGGGPVFVKLGTRVTYRVADLETWQGKHTYRSTADAANREVA